MLYEFYVKLFVEKDVFSYQNNIFQIICSVRNRHFNTDDKTKKALQINFSARAFDLQDFNKFLQLEYNHFIRFTLYASILKFCSRAINTC